MRTAFTSQSVVTAQGLRPASILAEDGVIVAVEDPSTIDHATLDRVYDFGHHAVLPGLVDTHVHINEPGRTAWEGFATATRAAAAGGYTTLVDMPLNSIPATTTVEGLAAKRTAAAGQCHVDFGLWGGLVEGNQDQLEALASAGVLGFKCFLVPSGVEQFPMISVGSLRRAVPVISRLNLPLLVHAELPGPIDAATAALEASRCDWRAYANYLASRPDEAELAAIRLLIELSRETKCHIHIVHLATAQALPELESARASGVPITVETCPHYLHFASETIPPGATIFKCAPPLRSQANREKLWNALLSGHIDLVATDHSPCPPELKLPEAGHFGKAWGGIASLSLALPVMWSEARERGGSLSDLARWMSTAPARLAGLSRSKGQIAPGCDADLVVFDPEASFVVDREVLHYRHPISAYMGETLRGVVLHTFLRGEAAFSRDLPTPPPRGRECVPRNPALP